MEPKDWISRNHRELLVQVERFLEAIDTDAGRSKSKLTAAQLAGLRAKKTALTELVETKESAEAALSAAVAAANGGYNDTAAELRALAREAQASSLMDDATRQAAGLSVREKTGKGHGEIPEVDDLICKPRPSGDNFLDWSGPTGSGITYDIEMRTSSEKAWEKIGYTTRTAWLHENAGAGTHREYRIVPQRSGRSGEPSNAALAY